MKNKIFRIIFLLATVALLTQCKEDTLLNRSPQDAPNAGNFFTNATSARQACVAIIPFWSTYWFYEDMFIPTYADIISDDAWLYGNRKNNSWRSDWTDWNIKPDFGVAGGAPLLQEWWRTLYQSINAASFAVDYIPTSSDKAFTPDMQAKYIGVAKMFRGLAYIYLTTLWGDVPLHKNFITNVNDAYVAKTPKSDVLLFAIEDLKYAVANMPDTWSGDDVGLPTKAAAAGFLTRAYLCAKDFPSAETAANAALTIANTDGYAMMDDYQFMESEASQPNNEWIFAFQFIPCVPRLALTTRRVLLEVVK